MTCELPYPKDDPATISALGTRLTAQGEVLRGAQQRLIGHRAGLEGAWKDSAGGRAAAEVGTVAGLVHTGDAAFSAASGALGAYRAALETARGDIDGLRRQAEAAATARSDYMHRYIGHLPPDERTAVIREANAQLATAESNIRSRYEAVGEQVTRAARTAAGTISELSRAIGAAPGSGDPAAAVAAKLDGVLPSVHQKAMTAKANEAADLAEKVPVLLSKKEAARLASYNRYAGDPAFATAFQQRLGPDGLLYLAGALTKMGTGDDPPSDWDKAAVQIQQLLASTLATATNPGNEPHLDAAWIVTLKKEGRKQANFRWLSMESYGYQLLGVLLRHGTYSSQFLNDVGGDMLDFEQSSGDGPELWPANKPAAVMYYRHFYADLIDRAGGFDPMVGLMKALAGNPEASKTFFATDPGATDSRVDYLLTDRRWTADYSSGPFQDKDDLQSPGTDYLGKALDGATTGRPRDATSASIMEAVVHHLGDDAETREGVASETDVAPANMRDSLGHMLSTYVGDVNAAFDGKPYRGTGQWEDPALPGQATFHARFDQSPLMRVLADTSKDPGAYAQLSDTQRIYTALALNATATSDNPVGPDTIGRDGVVEDRRTAIRVTAQRSASVFGALDFGHNMALEQAGTELDKATNDQLDANGKAASFVIGLALSRVPIPGLSDGADAYIDALVENSKVDSTGKTNYEIGQTYGNSQNVVSSLVYDALYHNNIYESTQAPPASLRDGGGHLVPVNLMTDTQIADYNGWVRSAGGEAMFAPVEDAAAAYGTSYDKAQHTLQDKDRG